MDVCRVPRWKETRCLWDSRAKGWDAGKGDGAGSSVRQAGVRFSVTVIKSLRSLKRNECWSQLGFRSLSSVIEQIMVGWHGEEVLTFWRPGSRKR